VPRWAMGMLGMLRMLRMRRMLLWGLGRLLCFRRESTARLDPRRSGHWRLLERRLRLSGEWKGLLHYDTLNTLA
jgi:hypothetical protein